MDGDIEIFSDGGARGNPGPSASAFVVFKNSKMIYDQAEYVGVRTNNQAEYEGVILALNWLYSEYKSGLKGSINFYMDSELVVNQLNGNYRVKEPNLKILYERVKDLIRKLKIKFYFKSVRRDKNKYADKLVNNVLDDRSFAGGAN